MGEVQWEAEFFALQDSNNKLAGALREANAAAAQWRQQLEAQRAEAERLRQRVRVPRVPAAGRGAGRSCLPRVVSRSPVSEASSVPLPQVADLEAQAAAEPPPPANEEGPSAAREQLEALVQTKDQVSGTAGPPPML